MQILFFYWFWRLVYISLTFFFKRNSTISTSFMLITFLKHAFVGWFIYLFHLYGHPSQMYDSRLELKQDRIIKTINNYKKARWKQNHSKCKQHTTQLNSLGHRLCNKTRFLKFIWKTSRVRTSLISGGMMFQRAGITADKAFCL